MGDALQLDNEKQLLKQYYAGQQMKSPNDGGFLILLGVRASDGGSATAMFECSVSSLRYEMPIPKVTRGERKAVKDVIDGGNDPDCPRHGVGTRLVRAGRDFICRDCGIPYGRV